MRLSVALWAIALPCFDVSLSPLRLAFFAVVCVVSGLVEGFIVIEDNPDQTKFNTTFLLLLPHSKSSLPTRLLEQKNEN